MYTLLDVCPGRLSIQDFITRVLAGLRDHYDIQLLTYLMVARLAGKYPSDVLQRTPRATRVPRHVCAAG